MKSLRSFYFFLIVAWVAVGFCSQAAAQSAAYVPMSAWERPEVRWGTRLGEAIEARTETSTGTRPMAISYRQRSLQILEDAYLLKRPRISRNQAREFIRSEWARSPAHLLGTHAEAMFVDRNPGWSFVRSANASQHDVYLRRPGMPPITGQIKVHMNGNAATYARDMVRDWRSPRFFVPDDHVGALRALLRQQGKWRDYNRVRGLGFTLSELEAGGHAAATAANLLRVGRYLPIGAIVALSAAEITSDAANGTLDAHKVAYQIVRGGSFMLADYLANSISLRVSAFRGIVRGQAVVAAVLGIVELAWLVGEHGWMNAFQSQSFYEAASGSLSAIMIFFYASSWSSAAAVASLGTLAPLVGLLVGSAAAILGSFVVSSMVHWFVETFASETMSDGDRYRLEGARHDIEMRLHEALTGLDP